MVRAMVVLRVMRARWQGIVGHGSALEALWRRASDLVRWIGVGSDSHRSYPPLLNVSRGRLGAKASTTSRPVPSDRDSRNRDP